MFVFCCSKKLKMKKLLLLFTVFISIQTFSQTTAEEYTWVTKSYIRVLTEGADIKRGYEISDLISSPAQTSGWGNENQFTFKNFKKENSSEIKAVIIIHYFNKVAKTVYCIPLANSDKSLWQSFYSNIDLLAGNQKTLLLYCISNLYIQTK